MLSSRLYKIEICIITQATMSSSAATSSRSNVTSMQQIPQHKRSLSFNHHLSYNQYNNPVSSATLNYNKHDSNSQIHLRDKNTDQLVAHSIRNNTKGVFDFYACRSFALIAYSFLFHLSANWSIVNLRPPPPLRPTLVSNSNNSTSSTGGGAILSNARKTQPTYEEDALVLRVIEAYCVAYQNPSRNAVHSGESTKQDNRLLFYLVSSCFLVLGSFPESVLFLSFFVWLNNKHIYMQN